MRVSFKIGPLLYRLGKLCLDARQEHFVEGVRIGLTLEGEPHGSPSSAAILILAYLVARFRTSAGLAAATRLAL